MTKTPSNNNPQDGPMQERRKAGFVQPERPHADDPASNTPDHAGIEIDNAIERPKIPNDKPL